ncbi:MAG: right-handed parallel beta-helix repeat-containing protein [Mycobacterium sp.]
MRKTVQALVVSVLTVAMVACQTSRSTSDPTQDDTASLQGMLNALRPGDTLTLEPRVYEHSGVLTVRVPGVHIDGNGATLAATHDETSAVQILADGVQFTNIRLTAPAEGPRLTALDEHKLVIGADDVAVSHINIEGSAAAGIFVNGAQHFAIHDVTVRGTRADGVHMTNGAGNGVVDDVRTDQTGDDGVAVVSYAADPASCHDITVSNVHVGSTRWGRGITVVGGANITMRAFTVANTDSAGVYVATEGDPYFTRTVDNVSISGGTITGANRNPDIVQGAVLVAAEHTGTEINNVSISDISIAATPSSAQRDVAIYTKAGTLRGIRMRDISLDDTDLTPFVSNADAGSFALLGWTAGGKPLEVN